MDLFQNDSTVNLLPRDGTVNYHGRVFDHEAAGHYLAALLKDIPWVHDEAVIFGRRIVTARQVAWYGDQEYPYTYSGTTKTALPWSRDLLAIKAVVEARSQERFSSCLINLYGDGSEGMSWHSDDERSLGRDTAIASVSFGAERKFALKHKREALAAAVILEHGSLLVMKGATQTHWLHSIPKAKGITSARVNLTFRKMIVG